MNNVEWSLSDPTSATSRQMRKRAAEVRRSKPQYEEVLARNHLGFTVNSRWLRAPNTSERSPFTISAFP